MIRSAIIIVAAILIMIPSLLPAGPVIPGFYGTIGPTLRTVAPTQLPVLKTGGIIYGASAPVSTANQMTIYQTQPKAVIDWQSFNIGSNASVYFNQQGNSTWAVLNRIWDSSPSQIYGSLKADGQVYLINQNGILFGPGSQVNVYGLIASSLNLNVDNWINNGTLAFNTSQGSISNTVAPGQQDQFYNPAQTPGVVSNTGTIQTGNLGSVFLIGPQVENSGTIITPIGQIGLIAGTDLELDLPVWVDANGQEHIWSYPGGESRTALMVKMNKSPQGSTASNLAGGYLAADTGLVGMYGNIVNQNGIIRSVTAVQTGGHVELLASDTISTGPNSLILHPRRQLFHDVRCLLCDAAGAMSPSAASTRPIPLASAGVPEPDRAPGAIVAPSGVVTMNASGRVYLASGSTS